MQNIGHSEEELVELIRQGDVAAMKEMYDKSVGRLSAVCARYVVDPDDVADVLQDSYLKAFDSIGSFSYRGIGSLQAWLTKIAVNRSLNLLKNRNRLNLVPLDERLPEPFDSPEPPETENIPPDVIQRMILNLPDGYRTVFNLFVFEGKSHKEIASILGIKENSSASQFHRAKQMLAKQIKQYNQSGR